MSKERGLSKKILNAFGGKENIKAVTYNMNSLSLTVVNNGQVNEEGLKKIKEVIRLVEDSDQLQVILGPGLANKVAAEITALIRMQMIDVQNPKSIISDNRQTPYEMFLRKLSSIFIPLIPAIVASGMITSLTNVAIQMGITPESLIINILKTLGNGIFAYLAIFVGINASKEFGGTPAMGGLAGVLLINPAIANIKISGVALIPGQGGIIGVLLVAWFMSWVEKQLRKIIPNAIDIIATPALTLLITGFATYIFLQPIAGYLSDGIVYAFKSLTNGGAIAGFILAGTNVPLVITGLHHGLNPVNMEFLNTFRQNPLQPIMAMGGAGQVGATFAVYVKTKNQRLKNIIKGALPVGILGIGEPLIYGVTLPLGRPFVTACIGAAFGGAVQASFHVSTIAMGVSGLLLTFLIKNGSAFYYLLGICVAYVASFLATWFVGFDDPRE